MNKMTFDTELTPLRTNTTEFPAWACIRSSSQNTEVQVLIHSSVTEIYTKFKKKKGELK